VTHFDDVVTTRVPPQSPAAHGNPAAPEAGPVAASASQGEAVPEGSPRSALRQRSKFARDLPEAGAQQQPGADPRTPKSLVSVRAAAVQQAADDGQGAVPPAGITAAPRKRSQIVALADPGGTPTSKTDMAAKAAEIAVREKAEKTQREREKVTLNSAIGRLQALATLDPERARQAIEKRILPAEVLRDSLGPQFTDEVIDLHALYQNVDAKAAAGKRSLDVEATFGASTIKGIEDARVSTLASAERFAAMGMALPTPEPTQLNPDQLAKVTGALKGQGQALQRMSERAARARPKTVHDFARRLTRHNPQSLEGTRRQDFVALVDRDIAALVTQLRIEPQHAARLLQGAVNSGQLGADALRPQDRALLLEVLAAKASNGGG